mmetsp:Transcript_2869/g.5981  ORF Transcript_2869/g.5981 Transcript_2869/m.5981 type:complete len:290 (+) Transcript_2869:669-1538(+)
MRSGDCRHRRQRVRIRVESEVSGGIRRRPDHVLVGRVGGKAGRDLRPGDHPRPVRPAHPRAERHPVPLLLFLLRPSRHGRTALLRSRPSHLAAAAQGCLLLPSGRRYRQHPRGAQGRRRRLAPVGLVHLHHPTAGRRLRVRPDGRRDSPGGPVLLRTHRDPARGGAAAAGGGWQRDGLPPDGPARRRDALPPRNAVRGEHSAAAGDVRRGAGGRHGGRSRREVESPSRSRPAGVRHVQDALAEGAGGAPQDISHGRRGACHARFHDGDEGERRCWVQPVRSAEPAALGR